MNYYTKIQDLTFYKLSKKRLNVLDFREQFISSSNCFEWVIKFESKTTVKTITVIMRINRELIANCVRCAIYNNNNYIESLSQEIANGFICEYIKQITFKRELLIEKRKNNVPFN